jgi:hypothetical protein
VFYVLFSYGIVYIFFKVFILLSTALFFKYSSHIIISIDQDLAPYHIRVNAISPALVGPSAMWDRQNLLHAQTNSPYFSRGHTSLQRL